MYRRHGILRRDFLLSLVADPVVTDPVHEFRKELIQYDWNVIHAAD